VSLRRLSKRGTNRGSKIYYAWKRRTIMNKMVNNNKIRISQDFKEVIITEFYLKKRSVRIKRKWKKLEITLGKVVGPRRKIWKSHSMTKKIHLLSSLTNTIFSNCLIQHQRIIIKRKIAAIPNSPIPMRIKYIGRHQSYKKMLPSNLGRSKS
jgi:hypothetical protein